MTGLSPSMAENAPFRWVVLRINWGESGFEELGSFDVWRGKGLIDQFKGCIWLDRVVVHVLENLL